MMIIMGQFNIPATEKKFNDKSVTEKMFFLKGYRVELLKKKKTKNKKQKEKQKFACVSKFNNYSACFSINY